MSIKCPLTNGQRNEGLLRVGRQVEALDDAANGIDGAQRFRGGLYRPLTAVLGLSGDVVVVVVAAAAVAIAACRMSI